LSKVRLRDPAGRVTDAKLPTLERMLSRMPAAAAMMIEIKAPDDRDLVHRVFELARGYAGRWTIQSFDERNLFHARELGLGPELGLLVESPEALAAAIKSPWAAVRMDYQRAESEVVGELRANGKQVAVWTVNDAPDIAKMARLGVDQIITDEPIMAAGTVAMIQE
jgi:glycerophosphoryl diester phosphodiesterase